MRKQKDQKCDFGLKLTLIDPCAVGDPRRYRLCPLNNFSCSASDSEPIVYAFLAKKKEGKKQKSFFTCHVAARSPGPGKLIFLPFDTHRIKKSHEESWADFFSEVLFAPNQVTR